MQINAIHLSPIVWVQKNIFWIKGEKDYSLGNFLPIAFSFFPFQNIYLPCVIYSGKTVTSYLE